MNFLSSVIAKIGQWLLEKLGSLLAKLFNRWKRDKKIDKEEDAKTDAVEDITDKIYKLEDEITLLKKEGKDFVQLEQKIFDLERRLIEASRHTDLKF